jgi:hypothetical protein
MKARAKHFASWPLLRLWLRRRAPPDPALAPRTEGAQKPKRDLGLTTLIATIVFGALTLLVADLTYRDAAELKERAETPHLTLAIHADTSSGLLVANLTNASTADAHDVRIVCSRIRPWMGREGRMRHAFPSEILQGQTSPLNIDLNCLNAGRLQTRLWALSW